MYVEASPLSPFVVAWLGFFAIGIGGLLMIEAGKASRRGSPASLVEREGSLGAKTCLAGLCLLAVAGVWTVLS